MKKIPTLFKRTFDDKGRIVETINEINDELKEIDIGALKPTKKMDGSCCAVIEGVFYKRYDAKRGKPIPESAIKCQEAPDPITGHLPCWVPVNYNDPCDKWFVEAYLRFRKEQDDARPADGTYEAIGKHFNGNKYGLEYDTLVKHGESLIPLEANDFEHIKEYLEKNVIEGIVFWDDEKPVCKIKRSDFGFKW